MLPRRSGAALLAVLGFATLSCQVQDAAAPSVAVRLRAETPVTDALAARLAERAESLKPAEIRQVAAAIRRESERHGLPVELVLAVIEVESRFDAFAVSPVGAMGLMQILPSTGEALAARRDLEWRGARTLLDPVANVTLGIAYLAELRDRFDHLPTALAAYNWGPGAIGRRLSAGAPIPRGYARRVMAAREHGAEPQARTS